MAQLQILPIDIELYGNDIHKIYGPYKKIDGRLIIRIYYNNERILTVSYPKFIMERHLHRKLTRLETVDHINNNHKDNRIENFQLLSPTDNTKKELERRRTHKQSIIVKPDSVCPMCGKDFKAIWRKQKYCSDSCKHKVTNKNLKSYKVP